MLYRNFLLRLQYKHVFQYLSAESNLLSELSLGVNDQLPTVVTDALLELHYGLVRLPPIPGTVHLVRLTVCAVTSVLLNKANLQHHQQAMGNSTRLSS